MAKWVESTVPWMYGTPWDPWSDLWSPCIPDGSFPSLMFFQSAGKGLVSSAAWAPGQFSRGNSGAVVGGIFPECFEHMPQTLLLGKWEGQGSTCQEWWLLMQEGGARTVHWEHWWLWALPWHVLCQGQEGWKAVSSTVLILLRQKQRWMTSSGSASGAGIRMQFVRAPGKSPTWGLHLFSLLMLGYVSSWPVL